MLPSLPRHLHFTKPVSYEFIPSARSPSPNVAIPASTEDRASEPPNAGDDAIADIAVTDAVGTDAVPLEDAPMVDQPDTNAAQESSGALAASLAEHADDDNRSSSLSELGDGPETNEGSDLEAHDASGKSADNDSEAETERLENSPQKIQRHTNVVLNAGKQTSNARLSVSSKEGNFPTNGVEGGSKSIPPNEEVNLSTPETGRNTAELDLPSTAPSLGGSAAESILAPLLPEVAGKKRKRTASGSRTVSDDEDGPSDEPVKKRVGSVLEERNGNGVTEHEDERYGDKDVDMNTPEVASEVASEADNDKGEEVADMAKNRLHSEERLSSVALTKDKKGRRKTKRFQDDHSVKESLENEANGIGDSPAEMDKGNEGDDIAEREADEEAAAKSDDEMVKKMAAMDALSAIEKQFASFRDRLFDERLAQLSNELAMLTQPDSTNPEFLAMLQCLDARRDEKIAQEQTLLSYKIRSLEVRCIAERSQLHSQYFQSVRAIREKKLEEVGEQWYQIQRDRRGLEGTVPDFSYKFPARRSQQITQQTAYNLEVSVLSGVAKYVGFPAAPPIEGARPSEMDEDFQKMAIKPRTRTASQQGPTRAAFSSAMPKPKPAAEEQFLEQTPWANPQHPAHQQHLSHIQRQMTQQPRTGSPFTGPFTTPAGQRRVVDFSAPNGSASTIGAASATMSSQAGTPTDPEYGHMQGQTHGRNNTEHLSPLHRLTSNPQTTAKPSATLAGAKETPSSSEPHPEGPFHNPSGLPSDSPAAQRQYQPSAASGVDQASSNSYNNSSFVPRTGAFGTPVGGPTVSLTSGDHAKIKDEDSPEKRMASPSVAQSSPLKSNGLPAGIGVGGPSNAR
ncbi:MAG: hypothetical protein M1819_004604 [Sarea resinae]|nr:MAG: hypothetical protein M1819_004604 [Sarea resinae]